MPLFTPKGPLHSYQHLLNQNDIKSDSNQLMAASALQTVFDQLCQNSHNRINTNQKKCNGIYLWGDVGTGKTMLMDLLHNSLTKGISYRGHFNRFMQQVHKLKSNYKNKQNPLTLVATYFSAQYRIICLDEFYVADIADAMILSKLLDSLLSKDMILVTTSNNHPDELYTGGLQRSRFLPAIEQIKKLLLLLNIDSGYDYRQAWVKSDEIYHTPLGANSESKLKSCFQLLSKNSQIEAKTLTLYGRKIAVRGLATGVVWFEFDALCKGARSNIDYIELARRYHTLILSNISLLDSSQDDAARRLIELVDELYDRDVKLIVSAAASADKLYTGIRLAKSFKRTISRLQQMSSKEYLSRPHYSY